ncbi:ABC transporter ATP-binding protein [Aureimonas sp. AU40]|uniref:ABC transporter ATP-binding protein n=1 Tax=Aureimonas sp. AU40 TaxID=1637747 RepID=UPI0009E8E25C|nr:sn-glycerol-3-phosphate ABC transporter ATP-binding protein UgpC [Aureimonas sp. AU40]
MADLSLQSIRKAFGAVEVIRGIDLSIRHGEFVVFVGPSGCGKSTLLRMIAGLEEITSGELRIGGRLCNDVEPSERGIAMVFQSYALYPHMSVYDNVGFGLKLAKTPKAERDRRVREAARVLQMEHLLERRPRELSGGQRQRVAIGRAIVRKPEVFLFDEPLSNLDAALRADTRMELARLHAELGATMIYVTHDQVEAMTLADKIVVLDGGVVQQVGRPIDLYKNPANLFVAGFIGAPKMNMLPVRVAAGGNGESVLLAEGAGEVLRLPSVAGLNVGRNLTLGLRPQALRLNADGSIAGEVETVERLGNETVVAFRWAGGRRWLAVIAGDHILRRGDAIRMAAIEEEVLLFDESGNRLPIDRAGSPPPRAAAENGSAPADLDA